MGFRKVAIRKVAFRKVAIRKVAFKKVAIKKVGLERWRSKRWQSKRWNWRRWRSQGALYLENGQKHSVRTYSFAELGENCQLIARFLKKRKVTQLTSILQWRYTVQSFFSFSVLFVTNTFTKESVKDAATAMIAEFQAELRSVRAREDISPEGKEKYYEFYDKLIGIAERHLSEATESDSHGSKAAQ